MNIIKSFTDITSQHFHVILLTTILLYTSGCNQTDSPSDLQPPVTNFDNLYKSYPDTTTCFEGKLNEAQFTAVISRINMYRAQCGLHPISHDTTLDQSLQKGALILSANDSLTNFPESTWKCYSSAGYDGCQYSTVWGKSKLLTDPTFTTYTNESIIDEIFCNKGDTNSNGAGNRRWFLNPFLRRLSFGRIDRIQKSGNAYRYLSYASFNIVQSFTGATTLVNNKRGIGYPQGKMSSASFDVANSVMSFYYIDDESNYYGNAGVDYTNTTVEIVEKGNTTPLTVRSIQYNLVNSKTYQGMRNHLQWLADGIVKGKTYTVRVKNFKTKTGLAESVYDFQID